jgi:hypothetical protein
VRRGRFFAFGADRDVDENLLLTLPAPARYFPPRNGRYDVAPGLFPLGTDFGNGATDTPLFQFDHAFPRYRANKLSCRAERFGKYVCADGFDAPVAEAAVRLIVGRLVAEHPAWFGWEGIAGGAGVLRCRITGDRLIFDERMGLLSDGLYADAFDALCCQIPEDIAVVRRASDRGDWIAALHLCAPSHWAAEAKIGRSFNEAHAPIPGFGKVAAAAAALTDACIMRGPFVRFTWGISFDDRLNAHPEPPLGSARPCWDGESPLFLRVERQTLWGLPAVDAFLFAIRVYVYDARPIRDDPEQREALVAALRSMSPESRRYKSVFDRFDDVLSWLERR